MDKKEYVDDIYTHIQKVNEYIRQIITELNSRALNHDRSKFKDPEKRIFMEYTPKLKEMEYLSDEYKKCLEEMQVALNHHYEYNRHHPEYYKNGIKDMTLVDIVEMLCDWKSASERSKDGDIIESLILNKERFNISDDLFKILLNTVEEYF